MDKQQFMSKPANKSKRVLQTKGDVSVFSERVYWGLVTDGGKDSPDFLVRDRKFAELCRATLPPDAREKATIVRTYVTVWQLDRPSVRPRRPRR